MISLLDFNNCTIWKGTSSLSLSFSSYDIGISTNEGSPFFKPFLNYKVDKSLGFLDCHIFPCTTFGFPIIKTLQLVQEFLFDPKGTLTCLANPIVALAWDLTTFNLLHPSPNFNLSYFASHSIMKLWVAPESIIKVFAAFPFRVLSRNKKPFSMKFFGFSIWFF